MMIDKSNLTMLKGVALGIIATLILSNGFYSESNLQSDKENSDLFHNASYTPTVDEPLAEIDEALPEPVKYTPQDFERSFASAAEKATPSVVTVAASKLVKQRSFNPFDFFNERRSPRGQEREYESKQAGSGVIISSDGYIVTNNHVVDGVEEITITLQDKREYDAEIIGADPLTDIALLKIDAQGLRPIKIADSEKLYIGQHVLAIGNPLSIGTTVTTGIVSALNRNIGILRDGYAVEKFIQTDAAINPGNSGGALVDLNGNLIGINTAIASATGYYSGYGFAVPTKLMSHVIGELREKGKVVRGYIGIRLQPVSYKMAKEKGFNSPKGVYVWEVLADMPGEEAGIEHDDIILEVDGVEVNEPNLLQAEISSKKADAKVRLKVYRDGETMTKTMQLRARPEEERTVNLASAETKLNGLGLAVKPLSEFKANQLEIDYGIEVASVERYTEAYRSNIQEGDVLLKIGGKQLKRPSDLTDYLESVDPGDTVKIFVQPANGSFKRYIYLDVPER